MVADSYTSRLGLITQGTGNNNNSWGDTFNNSFGAIIERAVAGYAIHADTGGTLDLSGTVPPAGPTQAIDYVQKFTGVLVSHLTVQMPNVQKTWLIDNSTSGNFQLFIRNGAAGGVIAVPQGCIRMVLCDGTGGMKREDQDQVGTFRYSGASTLQPGGLACAGQSLLRADYPDLFAKIGTVWGSLDIAHFSVPNFQDTGRFLRSSSGSLAVGVVQSSQNKSHTHTGSGTTSGVSAFHTHTGSGTTSTESATHNHSYNSASSSGNQKPNGTGTAPFDTSTGTVTGTQSANHTHTYNFTTSTDSVDHTHTYSFTTSTGSADGTEARPESAVVYISILY